MINKKEIRVRKTKVKKHQFKMAAKLILPVSIFSFIAFLLELFGDMNR